MIGSRRRDRPALLVPRLLVVSLVLHKFCASNQEVVLAELKRVGVGRGGPWVAAEGCRHTRDTPFP